MTNVGLIAQRINSQKYEVLLGGTDSLVLLQNASLNMSHSEFREPTTSGSNVYYSGLPDNVLSGTILYTTDLFDNAVNSDLKALFDQTNGEYAEKTIKITLTDFSGSSHTYTFTGKLTTCVVYKGAEGAVKADITFVLLGNPTELPA